MLFALRGVYRWRNARSSKALRMPSIQAPAERDVERLSRRHRRNPRVLLVDLEPQLALAVMIPAEPDVQRRFRFECPDLHLMNGWFGKMYMGAIRPFRYALVYPLLLRSIGRHWQMRAAE